MNRRGGFLSVTLGIATRQVLRLLKSPPLLIPSILFPLIMFAAFTGPVSAIAKAPNFGYPDYTAFILVFVLMQGAVFAGVLVGVSLADDFEGGIAKRLMLAVPQRPAIVLGYLLMAWIRTLVVAAILFVAGFIGGMTVRGTTIQLVGLIALMLIFSTAAALYAAGVALRTQSVQASPLMQLPMLVLMLLMPVYSPRHLLQGWIHSVANVNPFTTIVEAGRGLLEAQPVSVWQAYAIVCGFLAITTIWAMTGLRKAERTVPRAGGGRGGRRLRRRPRARGGEARGGRRGGERSPVVGGPPATG
jgi:ABC-type multidrug transport system permease subunit